MPKAVLVLLLVIAFAVSPAFSTFNGFDPSLYPVPQEDPPVQPAGYAFAIWGLIYAWLIVHAAFGLWKRAEDPRWDAPRWPLIVSLGVGVPWLAVAGISAIWATAMIWVMLAGALTALARTSAHMDRLLLLPPVAIYAGWLTAASSVSVGLLLAGYGILSEEAAAWTGLGTALAIGLAMQMRLGRAPEYGATVIWALVAVTVKDGPETVFWLAVAGIALLALAAIRAMAAEGRERMGAL